MVCISATLLKITPVKILRPSNSPIRLTKVEYDFDFLIPEHLSDHSWKANYCIVGLLHKRLIYEKFIFKVPTIKVTSPQAPK